jgi:hypothetical protein
MDWYPLKLTTPIEPHVFVVLTILGCKPRGLSEVPLQDCGGRGRGGSLKKASVC